MVILLLSVAAVALVIEHVMTIRAAVLMPPGLGEDVRALLASGNVAAADERCRQQPSFLAFVLSAGLGRSRGRLAGRREGDGRRHRRPVGAAVPQDRVPLGDRQHRPDARAVGHGDRHDRRLPPGGRHPGRRPGRRSGRGNLPGAGHDGRRAGRGDSRAGGVRGVSQSGRPVRGRSGLRGATCVRAAEAAAHGPAPPAPPAGPAPPPVGGRD